MILDWVKRKAAEVKQAKEMKREALIEEQVRAIDEFNTEYFANIKFPILILSEDDYTAVSDLGEYYFDSDIQRCIGPSSELLDSIGNRHTVEPNFETGKWVPKEKTGTLVASGIDHCAGPCLQSRAAAGV